MRERYYEEYMSETSDVHPTEPSHTKEIAGSLSKEEVVAVIAAEVGALSEADAMNFGVNAAGLHSLKARGLLRHLPIAQRWASTSLGRACASLACPRCYAMLSVGRALVGEIPGVTGVGKVAPRLTECVKCHSCGHSEYMALKP